MQDLVLPDTIRKGLDLFTEDTDLHVEFTPFARVVLVFLCTTREYSRKGRMK